MSGIIQIRNRAEHDHIVAASKTTPTVIHVSNSALPVCKAFSPKYAQLAQKYEQDGIKFAEMDFTSETSYMFKFSPNQLPVTVCVVREGMNTSWAKTVMGANVNELEMAIDLLKKEAVKDAA
ncbi:hypothetical protein AC579_424 [Pseudocercospora musae]|uniref:Thioredoxin domain-containing protein n=1 Tax=Pseudocercospora musae TaxID=113226 RepID=A0A139I3D9_9PEZI|nr:hypothetical protein AC579_424 [Pseudocercospora musae]